MKDVIGYGGGAQRRCRMMLLCPRRLFDRTPRTRGVMNAYNAWSQHGQSHIGVVGSALLGDPGPSNGLRGSARHKTAQAVSID